MAVCMLCAECMLCMACCTLGIGTLSEGCRRCDVLPCAALRSTAAPAAHCRCAQARGAGYAISREEELQTVRDVALATGTCCATLCCAARCAALLILLLHCLNANVHCARTHA